MPVEIATTMANASTRTSIAIATSRANENGGSSVSIARINP